MRAEVRRLQQAGERVGVVPTMGALHEGHLSLVHLAKKTCTKTVATIFVNPTQFAPHEDFNRYPRTLPEDLRLLASADCDYCFVPGTDEMYPAGYSTYVEPPAVGTRWEGECRPGHFRGVTTIVLKLLNMIPADVACFGQKDYQQAAVIRAMARDLNLFSHIEVGATIREPDGLAMSSRNRYLSPAERQRALSLSHGLRQAREMFRSGEQRTAVIAAMIGETLEPQTDAIDYVAIADGDTLEPVELIQPNTVILLAVRIGNTRLIDNCLITEA
ncbi:Pantoate-beta-alanine ligase [Anatilimnocola aggregata]|uniref:Pantothenate synthetase n=2 Tax=Anatilimnocola aggregata TaxID=2528021 RepID=A0A517YHU8_9BACT|nr:Pantoate-beta-alanine ligase [Anatilimnocola aggregata]